jgi:glycogen synthase
MLSVAYLIADFGSVNSGGISTYVHSIARYLASEGHRVEVITGRSPREVPNALPYTITELSCEGRGVGRLDLSLAFAESLAGRSDQFDLVEATDWGMEGFHCLKRRLAPCLIRFHTPNSIVERLNGSTRRQDSAAVNAVEAEYFASASFLSSPSRAMIGEVKRTWPGLAAVEHIRNPLLPTPYPMPPDRSGLRRFGFFGRLERRKGVYELATALATFLVEEPELAFHFAGPDTRTTDGSVGKDLRMILAGVIDRVKFLGYVEPCQRSGFLRSLECAVLPSLWDNAPYACVEVMLAGVPLLATGGSGFEELIGDSPHASIVRAGDSAALLEGLRERARASAVLARYDGLKQLSWAAVRGPTLALYQRVAAGQAV